MLIEPAWLAVVCTYNALLIDCLVSLMCSMKWTVSGLLQSGQFSHYQLENRVKNRVKRC